MLEVLQVRVVVIHHLAFSLLGGALLARGAAADASEARHPL